MIDRDTRISITHYWICRFQEDIDQLEAEPERVDPDLYGVLMQAYIGQRDTLTQELLYLSEITDDEFQTWATEEYGHY